MEAAGNAAEHALSEQRSAINWLSSPSFSGADEMISIFRRIMAQLNWPLKVHWDFSEISLNYTSPIKTEIFVQISLHDAN